LGGDILLLQPLSMQSPIVVASVVHGMVLYWTDSHTVHGMHSMSEVCMAVTSDG